MSFKFVCVMASSAMGIFGAAALAADVTGTTGGGQPHSTDQPSLGVNYIIALVGTFPSTTSDTSGQYLGEVTMFAGNFAPQGWAMATGQTISVNQNTALFNLLGTTYGGNGTTTFQLPNLQDKVAIGAGQGDGLTNRPLGSVSGSNTETLTIDQMPAHDHSTPNGPTGETGGGQPVSIMQPSLALNYFVDANSSAISGNIPMAGQIRMTAGNIIPGGLSANGQLLPTSTNSDLSSAIGNTFGGDGTNNLALPDLQGRVPIGVGTGAGLTTQTLGEKTGAEQVTLTEDQLPPHTHTLPGGGTTGVEGGGQAFSNMQPSLGLHYIIATSGFFPSRNAIINDSIAGSLPLLGQISLFAGDTAPDGWQFCDGQVLSSTDPNNVALFSIMGTTYGGDGTNTFDLPDLDGRVGVGVDNEFSVEGGFSGSEITKLIVAQIPAHDHTVPEPASLALIPALSLLLRRRQRVG